MKRITGLDWPLFGLAACLLALTVIGAIWITSFDDGNAGAIPLLQAVPYAVAAWLIVGGRQDRADSGRTLAAILIVGLAMRLLLLPGTPVSTDIFRYVWDGKVQGAGINPYLHLPVDAALSACAMGTSIPTSIAPTMPPRSIRRRRRSSSI